MKAILVVDMPSSCSRCIIFDDNQLLCCGSKVNYKESQAMRASTCPLKPLPEKKHNNGGYRVIDGTEWFYDSENDDGWNDCIDKLLGEDK